MQRLDQVLRFLATDSAWSYQAGGPSSAEPAALACLALACHERHEAARLPAQWLAEIQTEYGSVGVSGSLKSPAWPTSLAILAWNYFDTSSGRFEYSQAIAKALRWSLEAHGNAGPRKAQVGHDTTLVGWSWAPDTHSWMEPTCMFVMALKASGLVHHPRTQEAVSLIIDRLLPEGGCNYGNTIVLGQELFPHVQPTGLAMLALGGEEHRDERIGKSLSYLEKQLSGESSLASLCYGLMGLAAHGRHPKRATEWLEQAFDRLEQSETNSYKLALIALASCPHQHWLRTAEQYELSTQQAAK